MRHTAVNIPCMASQRVSVRFNRIGWLFRSNIPPKIVYKPSTEEDIVFRIRRGNPGRCDAYDRGMDQNKSRKCILPVQDLRHELLVDALSLFDNITTIHEPREYLLRKTVVRMRDAY